MALVKCLYAQVVMIHRRESDDIKEKYKTNPFYFQGQSVITKSWFDLDHKWLKEILMTREPDLY